MTQPIQMSETNPETVQDPDFDVLTEEDRPWRVIVWNDPINLMNYVTYVFKALFGFPDAKATSLMLDVHEKGRAVVSGGTRTESEKDVHNLHAYGLWATMEQDT